MHHTTVIGYTAANIITKDIHICHVASWHGRTRITVIKIPFTTKLHRAHIEIHIGIMHVMVISRL